MLLRWAALCAGGCGSILRTSETSAEKPLCLDCRAKRALLWCQWCNRSFRARNRNITAQFCCRQHWHEWLRWDHQTRLEQTYDVGLEVLGKEG